MESTLDTLTALGWGTLVLRPYVFAFLAFFLLAGGRDLGYRRALGFVVWGFAVAFAAEWTSTRVGVPFGLYHYTGETAGAELYLSNVPFFDSLSFPFLAYASFCLARWALPGAGSATLVGLSGVLMMLLDVVIDPLAVRGDQWFLGRIFYYPDGGAYFGVPLSNFAGWVVVGWLIVGGYVAATWTRVGAKGVAAGPALGVGLYYGVLAFNLAVTGWIGERALLVTGTLLHVSAFLLLYCVRLARGRAGGAPAASGGPPSAGRAPHLRAGEG
jgi:putative membrane protein